MIASLGESSFTTHKVRRPFDDPPTAEGMVLTMVAHMYHHRGQLHLYLKQLGRPVDTDTVYAS